MCSERFENFSQDFFGKVKNGHFFCPIFENPKTVSQKTQVCDHNSFFWSGHRKNNFKIVMIIFF